MRQRTRPICCQRSDNFLQKCILQNTLAIRLTMGLVRRRSIVTLNVFRWNLAFYDTLFEFAAFFCSFPCILTFCCPLLNFHPFLYIYIYIRVLYAISSFVFLYFHRFSASAIIVEYFLLYILLYIFFFFFRIYSTHGWYIFCNFITFSYGSLYFIESLNRSGFFECYLKKNGGLSEREKCVKGD